ncbi:glycosyltransferase family 2 protein, partial [candidate division KSB1 bacterium]|nr:glycosyltransferase family 2 protein [candidate division KSB1 bacterium]
LEKNTGTTYSRNLALKNMNGGYVCIMDSDVEVLPGSFGQLLNTLNKNDKAGIVVPRLNYPDGRLQKSTDVFPTVLNKAFRYFFLKIIEKKDDALSVLEGVWPVDYAISAMWVMKRELLNTIGLLDENIFYAPEDVDYCLRTWKAGYSILYNSEVKCIHHSQEISRGLTVNKVTINHIKGLVYYFRKHKYFLRKPDVGMNKNTQNHF